MTDDLRRRIKNIVTDWSGPELEDAIFELFMSELNAMRGRCAPRTGVCFKKRRYATQVAAEDALRRTRAEYPNDASWMRVYHCEGCMGFHVGKQFQGLKAR